MSDYKEAREKIFEIVDGANFKQGATSDEATSQIFNLTWPDGSKMIGVLSQDQSLPPYNNHAFGIVNEQGRKAQRNMFKANFRRLAKEE